jgi:hypothetical protein
MNSNQIRDLSDSALLLNLKTSVSEERKHTAEVLEFLREVDRRKLYADLGHASLWDFCTKELGYSASAAFRRISSMRLLRDLPDLKDDLLSGKQNLSSLAQAQSFFKIEEKHRESKLTNHQKKEVLERLEGKSTRECEKELLKLSSAPLKISRPEKARLVDETHTELRLVLDSDLLEKLKRIQALRSHAEPSMSYTELLKFMADEVLKRLDPVEKAKVKEKAKAEKLLPTRRAAPEVKQKSEMPRTRGEEKLRSGKNRRVPIPAAVKHQVWLRDRGKYGHLDSKTGKTCDSRHFLEIDHILLRLEEIMILRICGSGVVRIISGLR